MPGCAAVGCVNSARKGFLMKKFPKDPIRRKEWTIKTNRANWVPTDSAVLCEVHFEPDMWERTREDGSRRLRTNAVPTIFPTTKRQVKQKALVKRKHQISSPVIEPEIQINVCKGVCREFQNPIEGSSTDCLQKDEPLDNSSVETTPLIVNSSSDSRSNEKTVFKTSSEQEKLNMYPKLYIQAHFEPNMWDQTRENGSRKLKANAVPTIYSPTKGQVKQNTLLKRKKEITCPVIEPEIEISVCQEFQNPIQDTSRDFSQNDKPLENPPKEATSLTVNSNSDSTNSNEKTIFKKLSEREQLIMYSKLYRRKLCSSKTYRNKLRCAELKIKRLQQQLIENKSEISEVVNKLFNKDQVLALKKINNGKSTKFMKWSNETITKALELMITCGNTGYQELLNHNLPYPSIRTLQRRLKN